VEAPAPAKPETAAIEETPVNVEPEPVVEEEPVVVEEEPVRKSFFSGSQMSSIRQTGADIESAQTQRAQEARIAEEKRREAERIAEQKRLAQIAEEKRQTEERRREAERQAAQQAAEAQRIAAEQRQKAAADAQRAAEEAERQRQARAAENKRIADEAERQRQAREAQAQEQARIAAPTAGVRYDGVYQSPLIRDSGTPYYFYLRFYEDKTVIECGAVDKVKNLKKWFDKESDVVHKGKYKISGNGISFTVKSPVDYWGSILDDGNLLLDSHSHINGNKRSCKYSFVKW
jgi:hypothetical protein